MCDMKVEMYVRLIYLWTRDAGIPATDMLTYVRDRLPIAGDVQFSDPARERAARQLTEVLVAVLRGEGAAPGWPPRLAADPYLESTADAPEEDYEAEGFAWCEEQGIKVDGLRPQALWWVWHRPSYASQMWVVRFEVVGGAG